MYKELTDKDLTEYAIVDELAKGIFEYKLISVIRNKKAHYRREDKAGFVHKRCILEPDIHLGEKAGQMIANKVGMRCCKIDLYRQPVPEFGRVDLASISYIDLGYDDRLISNGVREYAKKNNIDNVYLPDIDLIFAAMKEVYRRENRPYEEYQEFMQDFIDMMMYDIKFGNTDRLTPNWFVRKNLTTGKIDLYPLFDNEGILGFPDKMPEILDEETIKKANESMFPIGRINERGTGQRVPGKEILEYLLENYPNQMRVSIKKMYSFTLEDLEEILDNLPGLSDERREYVTKNFEYRDRYVKEVIENYVRREKENVEQIEEVQK